MANLKIFTEFMKGVPEKAIALVSKINKYKDPVIYKEKNKTIKKHYYFCHPNDELFIVYRTPKVYRDEYIYIVRLYKEKDDGNAFSLSGNELELVDENYIDFNLEDEIEPDFNLDD